MRRARKDAGRTGTRAGGTPGPATAHPARGTPGSERFDRAYYARFYGAALHGAAGRKADRKLGDLVCAYLDYLGQPVRSAIDLGCGLGVWRDVIARAFPGARYTGVELSEYLCTEHGWTRGSVVDFRAPRPFDLVICDDVLQYLGPRDAAAAIDNLAGLCRGALYLHVLTAEDWEENCDRSRTDTDVHLRSAAWYRKRLQRHFTAVGAGLYLGARSPAIPWELEKLGR